MNLTTYALLHLLSAIIVFVFLSLKSQNGETLLVVIGPRDLIPRRVLGWTMILLGPVTIIAALVTLLLVGVAEAVAWFFRWANRKAGM